MKVQPCLILAAVLACHSLFVASASAQLLVDFSSATQFANNFVQTGPQAGNMTWSSTNGVGGVSGVVLATSGNTDQTLIYNTGFNWTALSTASTSILFQYTGIDAGSTRVYAQLGFLESNTASYNGGGGNDYVSVRIRNSGGTQLEFQGQSANNGTATNAGTTLFNTSGNIVLNNWYLLTGNFTPIGANQISFTSTLVDYGATGTTPGSTISSINGTFSIANSFYTDTEIFNGVRSTINSSQGYLDNYTVIPEPSTYALLLGGLTALFMLRRSQAKSTV